MRLSRRRRKRISRGFYGEMHDRNLQGRKIAVAQIWLCGIPRVHGVLGQARETNPGRPIPLSGKAGGQHSVTFPQTCKACTPPVDRCNPARGTGARNFTQDQTAPQHRPAA